MVVVIKSRVQNIIHSQQSGRRSAVPYQSHHPNTFPVKLPRIVTFSLIRYWPTVRIKRVSNEYQHINVSSCENLTMGRWDNGSQVAGPASVSSTNWLGSTIIWYLGMGRSLVFAACLGYQHHLYLSDVIVVSYGYLATSWWWFLMIYWYTDWVEQPHRPCNKLL